MKATVLRHSADTIRVWAGWLAVVCIISLEFGMLWRFGNDCLQAMTLQDSNVLWAEVQLAFR